MARVGVNHTSSESDEWNNEQWTVDCPCGVTYDDGEEMVQCDLCSVWVHTGCCNVPKHPKHLATYVCDKCRRLKHSRGKGEDDGEMCEAEGIPEPFHIGKGGDGETFGGYMAGRCESGPFSHERTDVAGVADEDNAGKAIAEEEEESGGEVSIENRVHKHGRPDGDPRALAGVSSVFSKMLWRVSGLVPKVLNFQCNDLPPPVSEDVDIQQMLLRPEPIESIIERERSRLKMRLIGKHQVRLPEEMDCSSKGLLHAAADAKAAIVDSRGLFCRPVVRGDPPEQKSCQARGRFIDRHLKGVERVEEAGSLRKDGGGNAAVLVPVNKLESREGIVSLFPDSVSGAVARTSADIVPFIVTSIGDKPIDSELAVEVGVKRSPDGMNASTLSLSSSMPLGRASSAAVIEPPSLSHPSHPVTSVVVNDNRFLENESPLLNGMRTRSIAFLDADDITLSQVSNFETAAKGSLVSVKGYGCFNGKFCLNCLAENIGAASGPADPVSIDKATCDPSVNVRNGPFSSAWLCIACGEAFSKQGVCRYCGRHQYTVANGVDSAKTLLEDKRSVRCTVCERWCHKECLEQQASGKGERATSSSGGSNAHEYCCPDCLQLKYRVHFLRKAVSFDGNTSVENTSSIGTVDFDELRMVLRHAVLRSTGKGVSVKGKSSAEARERGVCREESDDGSSAPIDSGRRKRQRRDRRNGEEVENAVVTNISLRGTAVLPSGIVAASGICPVNVKENGGAVNQARRTNSFEHNGIPVKAEFEVLQNRSSPLKVLSDSRVESDSFTLEASRSSDVEIRAIEAAVPLARHRSSSPSSLGAVVSMSTSLREIRKPPSSEQVVRVSEERPMRQEIRKLQIIVNGIDRGQVGAKVVGNEEHEMDKEGLREVHVEASPRVKLSVSRSDGMSSGMQPASSFDKVTYAELKDDAIFTNSAAVKTVSSLSPLDNPVSVVARGANGGLQESRSSSPRAMHEIGGIGNANGMGSGLGDAAAGAVITERGDTKDGLSSELRSGGVGGETVGNSGSRSFDESQSQSGVINCNRVDGDKQLLMEKNGNAVVFSQLKCPPISESGEQSRHNHQKRQGSRHGHQNHLDADHHTQLQRQVDQDPAFLVGNIEQGEVRHTVNQNHVKGRGSATCTEHRSLQSSTVLSQQQQQQVLRPSVAMRNAKPLNIAPNGDNAQPNLSFRPAPKTLLETCSGSDNSLPSPHSSSSKPVSSGVKKGSHSSAAASKSARNGGRQGKAGNGHLNSGGKPPSSGGNNGSVSRQQSVCLSSPRPPLSSPRSKHTVVCGGTGAQAAAAKCTKADSQDVGRTDSTVASGASRSSGPFNHSQSNVPPGSSQSGGVPVVTTAGRIGLAHGNSGKVFPAKTSYPPVASGVSVKNSAVSPNTAVIGSPKNGLTGAASSSSKHGTTTGNHAVAKAGHVNSSSSKYHSYSSSRSVGQTNSAKAVRAVKDEVGGRKNERGENGRSCSTTSTKSQSPVVSMPPPPPHLAPKRAMASAGSGLPFSNVLTPMNDEEYAKLLHHELNSSPRMPRMSRVVPGVVGAGRINGNGNGMGAFTPAKRTANSQNGTANSGNLHHEQVSRKRAKDDRTRDGSGRHALESSLDSGGGAGRQEKKGVACNGGVGESRNEVSKRGDEQPERIGDGQDGIGNSSFRREGGGGGKGFKTDNDCGAGRSEMSAAMMAVPSLHEDGVVMSGEVEKRANPSRSSSGERKTTGEGKPVTLPVVIEEEIHASSCSTLSFEVIYSAVSHHWHKLRKPNGERYSHSSYRQAVLDCLRNRPCWAHLADGQSSKLANGGAKRRWSSSPSNSDDEGESNCYQRLGGLKEKGKSCSELHQLVNVVIQEEGLLNNNAQDQGNELGSGKREEREVRKGKRKARRRRFLLKDGSKGSTREADKENASTGAAGVRRRKSRGKKEPSQEADSDPPSSSSDEDAVSNYSEEDEEMVGHVKVGVRTRRRWHRRHTAICSDSSHEEGEHCR